LGCGHCGSVVELEEQELHGLEKLEDASNSSIAEEKRFTRPFYNGVFETLCQHFRVTKIDREKQLKRRSQRAKRTAEVFVVDLNLHKGL
jgi:hypothetical protein